MRNRKQQNTNANIDPKHFSMWLVPRKYEKNYKGKKIKRKSRKKKESKVKKNRFKVNTLFLYIISNLFYLF